MLSFIVLNIVLDFPILTNGARDDGCCWRFRHHAVSSEFCLLWENADLVVRKPGHASMTSTSDVEHGWRQDHLAHSLCSPGGGHLDVIHVYRWAEKWPRPMLRMYEASTSRLPYRRRAKESRSGTGQFQKLMIWKPFTRFEITSKHCSIVAKLL